MRAACDTSIRPPSDHCFDSVIQGNGICISHREHGLGHIHWTQAWSIKPAVLVKILNAPETVQRFVKDLGLWCYSSFAKERQFIQHIGL